MASSNYPFSESNAEIHLTKNIFGLFNVVQLSKCQMVDRTWNAFIDQDIFAFDDALKQKMQKVKRYLPHLQPYSSHFNLYYNKNGGFILDILKSTIGKHRDGVKNELVTVLQDELPFLKKCNPELGFFDDNLFFWSPDGITFYQLQQENPPVSDARTKTFRFRTDENIPITGECCRIQFSAMKSFGSKEDFAKAKAILLNISYEPIREYERCPDHLVEMLLYFIMQNKIRMVPLKNRKKTVCLIPFGSYNDLLLITRQKNNKFYLLYVRENDVWRHLPCNYSIDYINTISVINIYISDIEELVLTFSNEKVVTQCEIELSNGTRKPISPIDPIVTEEILTGLDFLNRGVNPRPTPLDVIARPQPELLEDPDNLSKVNRLS